MTLPPSGLVDTLRERWRRRLPEASGVGEALLARYGDPSRVYHDRRHLADVLEGVDLLGAQCRDVTAVELAAWFHDAVYEVEASDNEDASAVLARRDLAPYCNEALVDEVARLVLLTRDHVVADGDLDGAVLCDADIAVLARPPAAYDDYLALVRREYAVVPDDAFRTGRAAILRALLDRPHLFSTGHGRGHWEEPARANLRRELASLIPEATS